MSLLDNEDILFNNIDDVVIKKSIKGFLSNYCMAIRVFEEVPNCMDFDLAYTITQEQIMWRRPLTFETDTYAIRHIQYNKDFFIGYTPKDGWVIYLLNCNNIVIRGKVGEIPDYIKFKSITNENVSIYLINCDINDESEIDISYNGATFIKYNAVRYI